MRVEYQNTLDDLRALRRVLPLKRRMGVVRYVVASAMPGESLLAALGDWQALAICGAVQVAGFYFGKPHILSVIPKTAFESRLECDQFLQLARQWKARANHEAAPDNAPPRIDTGNPYQSPAEG